MTAKQDAKKIRAWKNANVHRVTIEIRKELDIPNRIAAAVDAGYAASRQDYIIKAVSERLERDGFPQ